MPAAASQGFIFHEDFCPQALRSTDQALSSLAASLALPGSPALCRLHAFSRSFLHNKLRASPKQRAAFAEEVVKAVVEALPSRPVVVSTAQIGPPTARSVPGLLLPCKRTRGLRTGLRTRMRAVLVTASLGGDVGEVGADHVTRVGQEAPRSMLDGTLQVSAADLSLRLPSDPRLDFRSC